MADHEGGGAVTLKGGQMLFDRCTFQGNSAAGSDMGGGALLACLGGHIEVRHSVFLSNTASRGGALSSDSASETRFTAVDCSFVGNSVAGAQAPGGAVYLEGPFDGTFPPPSQNQSTFVNCLFAGNSAPAASGIGGAMCLSINLSPTLTNCLLRANTSFSGAGIYVSDSTPTLTNCTLANNTASLTTGNGGGVYAVTSFSAMMTFPTTLRNTIAWGNSASGTDVAAKQVYVTGALTSVDARYSCFQDGVINGVLPAYLQGTGNIDADPLFANPSIGENHLRNGSPAMDAGDSGYVPIDSYDVDDDLDRTEKTPDIGRNVRLQDSRCASNTGLPDATFPMCGIVDMGAFEARRLSGLVIRDFIQCVRAARDPGVCPCDEFDFIPDSPNAGVGIEDIPCFVQKLLTGDSDCQQCSGTGLRFRDCNANGIPDANDIADGTSLDCNQNFIPDECDLDEADPDGNEAVSADMNGNGVPDECEPDCNGNQVPDAWDIGQQTSADVNANAVPDECEADCNQNDLPDSYEIAQQTVPDCNANGIPDGCEADCNANGVPDDCDIDPTDPDGNSSVSPDCNANGVPDSCDLSLPPPFGSVDCNNNGIPDECDIGSGHCWDENNNGVCDNCEGGSMEGRSGEQAPNRAPTVREGSALDGEDTAEGGNGNTAEGGGATSARGGAPSEEAAWEAYYEWSMAQIWGPASGLTGEEQFLLIQEKAMELGLDVAEIVGR